MIMIMIMNAARKRGGERKVAVRIVQCIRCLFISMIVFCEYLIL